MHRRYGFELTFVLKAIRMRIFIGMVAVVSLALVGYGLYSSNVAESDTDDSERQAVSRQLTQQASDPTPTMPANSPDAAETADEPNTRPGSSDERCFAGVPDSDSAIAGQTIIVDPGHGGEDLGTVNNTFGLHETEFVLNISRLLKDLLVADGANVCMTRIEDVYIELVERAHFANEHDGDVFVSVHLNSLPDPTENYTMAMWGSEAKDRFLAEQLIEVLRHEMAIPEYHNSEPNPMNPDVYRIDPLDSRMLKTAEMPAVLIEAAFLSNHWEAQVFLDGVDDGSRWREVQIAEALHTGLENYFAAFE